MIAGRSGFLSALAALAMAGCGGSDSGTPDPQGAPPEQFEPERPDPELAATVAVVDLAGAPAAEPARLYFSSDASLVRLRWRNWGERRATGDGVLRLLRCNPTCAEGDVVSTPARIVLSRPVACAGQRYYDAAEITTERDFRAGTPRAFIEAPC